MATDVSDEKGTGHAGDPGVDCDEAIRQLYRYLDGDLTDARRQKIALHLDECGWCGDAAGFEAELRVVIASRCRDRVPESLRARVAAAINEEALRDAGPNDGSGPWGAGA